MKASSRTQNTIRNIIYSILSLLSPLVLVLVQRTVFVRVLSVEYLGVNNLFADIFAMLSLFEMGAGDAFTYFFYQPLAQGDFSRVRSLTQLYRTIYRIIGILVFVVGFSLTPFLPHLVKSKQMVPHFKIIYWLQLLTVSFSYFSGHQRSLFVADQKAYFMSLNDMVFRLLKTALPTSYLWFYRDFIGFIALGMFVSLVQNILIVRMGKKHYPYAQGRGERLSKEERAHIFSRVRALMMHKIGGAVYNGTDNLLISKLVGLSALGLYANYEAIKNFIGGFQHQIFSAAIPSIGNIGEKNSENHLHQLFKRLFYLNYVIAFFSSACLYFLLTPFIEIWLGKDYTLEPAVVMWIAITSYLAGIRLTALSFVNARGLFYQTRLKAISEAIFNIIFSLIFGRIYGVAGVMMGSAIGFALNMWMDPYYLYKLAFKRPIFSYFMVNIKLALWSLLALGSSQFLMNYLSLTDLPFIPYATLVIILAMVIGLLPLMLSEEFPYYKNLLKEILSKIRPSS